MRVGIITLPLDYNYGGILQAYALQTSIQRLGFDVCHIAKHIDINSKLLPDSFPRRFISYPLRFAKKHLLGNKNIIVNWEARYNETELNLCNNTRPFIEKYINIKEYCNYSDIAQESYDAIVVGSDQVWRRIYFDYPDRIQNAFLEFAEYWHNVKRISYAASFGKDNVDEYDDATLRRCSELLRKFDAVSVREESGISICRNFFGVDAIQLLDPTLLLDKEDYINLIGNYKHSAGNLFYYILDETPELVNQISRSTTSQGFKPFRVNALPMTADAPLEDRIQRPVEEWLRAFYDSDFVITDSFHGCVFSIIFNKPFYVIGNSRRGVARIQSLLQMFGLYDRLVTIDQTGNLKLDCIDWNYVNSKRAKLKEASLEFLKTNLNEKKNTVCN